MTEPKEAYSGAFVTTGEIYREVRELNKEVTRLKTLVTVFGFFIAPIISTIAALLIPLMIGT